MITIYVSFLENCAYIFHYFYSAEISTFMAGFTDKPGLNVFHWIALKCESVPVQNHVTDYMNDLLA